MQLHNPVSTHDASGDVIATNVVVTYCSC